MENTSMLGQLLSSFSLSPVTRSFPTKAFATICNYTLDRVLICFLTELPLENSWASVYVLLEKKKSIVQRQAQRRSCKDLSRSSLQSPAASSPVITRKTKHSLTKFIKAKRLCFYKHINYFIYKAMLQKKKSKKKIQSFSGEKLPDLVWTTAGSADTVSFFL